MSLVDKHYLNSVLVFSGNPGLSTDAARLTGQGAGTLLKRDVVSVLHNGVTTQGTAMIVFVVRYDRADMDYSVVTRNPCLVDDCGERYLVQGITSLRCLPL